MCDGIKRESRKCQMTLFRNSSGLMRSVCSVRAVLKHQVVRFFEC